MDSPNPVSVGISIVRSLATVRRPRPSGSGRADAGRYGEVLSGVARGGPPALTGAAGALDEVIGRLAEVEPDELGRDEALAFWLDLYNAGALALAARAAADGESSVLRVPGGFGRPFVTVSGESLSLDAIEHAKVRRFGDPRVHGALVCGSVSCPTLRPEPYSGTDLGRALDDQMRAFLSGGGLEADRSGGVVHVSRVFSWFGGDLVRPHRMPTFLPARRRAVVAALQPWIDLELADWIVETRPEIRYQPYDWGLRCTVG